MAGSAQKDRIIDHMEALVGNHRMQIVIPDGPKSPRSVRLDGIPTANVCVAPPHQSGRMEIKAVIPQSLPYPLAASEGDSNAAAVSQAEAADSTKENNKKERTMPMW